MSNEIKLELLENAYNFLNESLRNAAMADEDAWQWKFALINSAQAIELFLKERLRREHPLLVYSNIDKPRHTVSLDVALDRLTSCEIHLDDEDLKRVKRARDIRNDLVHFSANLTIQQLENSYVDLFEFAHTFHQKELDGELHDSIDKAHWFTEATLMEKFRREFVTYQGGKIVKWFASEIARAQFFPNFSSRSGIYDRIPYGHDWTELTEDLQRPTNCRDCGVIAGQFHAVGCDQEECPRCHHQLITCTCDWTKPAEWWSQEAEVVNFADEPVADVPSTSAKSTPDELRD